MGRREAKRRKDEEDSRFINTAVLNGRYALMDMLGKGGFSEVYRAFDVKALREVAIKVHQLNSSWSEAKKQSYVRHAVREYNIQKGLKNPRVVALTDLFEIDHNTFATVLEVCLGGDLEGHLREHGSLPEKEAKAIVAQILQGLAYLNDPGRRIIHYDLKPANILFDSFGEVKITVSVPTATDKKRPLSDLILACTPRFFRNATDVLHASNPYHCAFL